jgi:hypothetical protein
MRQRGDHDSTRNAVLTLLILGTLLTVLVIWQLPAITAILRVLAAFA